MLTETFIASTRNPERASSSTTTGIHSHDFQPIPSLKSTFKKNSINVNCLAVSTTHIFAAQSDKAVIHVYSRERNNQEAIVPFPERIHSLALAGGEGGVGTLIVGTEGGRVILWELGTGRQVSTPQHHLHPTTCLAVDPMSSVLLSGSPDSNIHVWSIPQLLSFSASSADQDDSNPPFAPLRSLLNHRDAINAILFGHIHSNNNIAVSASTDKSCLVWDYMEGELLHTFLLAENPLGLALDPADRAVYVGYENGNVQFIDFYRQKRLTQLLHTNEDQSAPTQPDASTIWIAPEATTSAVLCLQVSYDGTNLLSGHKNGKVLSWNVATGSFGKQLADFAAPVTNLHMLKPSGFPNTTKPPLKLQNVVKPRYESFSNGYSDAGTSVPFNYTITAQFTTTLPLPGSSDDDLFHQALTHSSFPPQMLDDSLAQFLASQDPARNTNSSAFAELRAQNAALMSQLNAAEESRRIAAAEIEEFKKLDWRRRQDEELRAAQKQRRRLTRLKSAEVARKKAMGEAVEDDEMEDEGDEEGLSSSTNELTDSG